ncbi:MAG TPA: translation initiation factor IF-2 subunit alpha [Candidatus Nanoarchaeia archaeon]|nr:translation initiation factor IF-2 subunit alpha [Candidatus Nanoarchaeia archaeon]
MFYKRSGFPEEQELVLCTVTNVQGHAVFAKIEEYGISGMIHISEVAPGRIRNIREFVKEGKVVVCKVLRVNKERGHVDLSLRRVTEMQKRMKTDALKNEQRAEKIIEQLAHQLKEPVAALYESIAGKLLTQYAYLHQCFEEVASDSTQLTALGISEKISTPLTELIKQRIKPPEVTVSGTMTISSYAPNGIDIIRKTLLTMTQNPAVNVTYLGGGKYQVHITAGDYKTAEEHLANASGAATKYVEEHNGIVTFAREEH